MSKLIITGFIALCMLNIVTHADPVTPDSDTFKYKGEVGIGIGGVLGGLIAGPPGVILGMASGAWFGDRDQKKDERITGLNDELIRKQTDNTILEKRFADLQLHFGNELQKVSTQNRISSLKELSDGVSLAVYFRTGSSNIDVGIHPRIEKLADFLKQYPDVRLLVEGHADKRGNVDFNRVLGQKRARAVEAALLKAGIDQKRIMTHSYGETRAKSTETDMEGNYFDRKVNITLTLDTLTAG
jgi:outer membrane protein OmpA-like peptidoglycan-associated protein